MVPARSLLRQRRTGRPVRGHRDARLGREAQSASSNPWAPADRPLFDLSPSVLSPPKVFRNYVTIVSNTDVRNAEAFTALKSAATISAERGVPHADAPEADAGLTHAGVR
jgi:hypothetical protein